MSFNAPHTFAEALDNTKDYILDTWLTDGTISMIYAPTGAGKSCFAMQMAFCISQGIDFLSWASGGKRRVVYLDGEMGKRTVAHRFRVIRNSYGDRVDLGAVLDYYTQEDFKTGLNLARPDIQNEFLSVVRNYDVIILDNYVTLFTPLSSDKTDSDIPTWERTQSLLLKLRELGKAVILIHHAGKSGAQLGTARKEYIIDNNISMRRFCDEVNNLAEVKNNDVELRVVFDKERHREEGVRDPLWVKYFKNDLGGLSWEFASAWDKTKEKIRFLNEKGLPFSLIADALGVKLDYIKHLLTSINSTEEDERPLFDRSKDLEDSHDLF